MAAGDMESRMDVIVLVKAAPVLTSDLEETMRLLERESTVRIPNGSDSILFHSEISTVTSALPSISVCP